MQEAEELGSWAPARLISSRRCSILRAMFWHVILMLFSPLSLIYDRDSKYTLHADSLLEDAGTKVIRLPVRSPDLNAYKERRIRSLRQECLDRVIIPNEAHLRCVLRKYVRYHNERRPHQSLGHLAPEAPDAYPSEGRVVTRPLLGDLFNDYCRFAA